MSRRSGKGSRETRLERTDPNRCSRVDWQTRLAVWLVGAVPVDRDEIFARGQLCWIPKLGGGRRKTVEFSGKMALFRGCARAGRPGLAAGVGEDLGDSLRRESRKKLGARLIVRSISVVRLKCMREYGFNEPNIDMLLVSGCSGDSGTQKPILLHLDDRSEVVRFCRSFAPLRAVLLVLTCFVLWAERFTCRPRLEIDIQKRLRNPPTRLSQCFPSVLMCSETIVISVCSKQVSKEGVCECLGVPRLKKDASDVRPDVPLVILAPRGIFRIPYWIPSDTLVMNSATVPASAAFGVRCSFVLLIVLLCFSSDPCFSSVVHVLMSERSPLVAKS
ncbi:hypothetical protein CRG98_001899 [Punica granatum]|uniref:Uncharacterized protein n=1 Tax=Punica granatum TaxID=22663 RepID=A0A2I0LAK8_PUNGR|nr:hypothetical protein CRG98_001899 [Punica granatum]